MGAISQYVGAAIAVGLFGRLGAPGVGWLRVGFSALLLLAWRRFPPPRSFSRSQWCAIAAFGATLGPMNVLYYLAIERLPLGTATAIEFSGPIAVAAFGMRGRRAWLSLGLATLGVLLLADVRWQGSGAGVGLALAAAAMWAGYVVLGKRMVRQGDAGNGMDSLAWSLVVAAVVIAPVGLAGLVRDSGDATTTAVLGCVLVGMLSNVIPYGLDMVVLARLSSGQFALLLSLLPLTAALVGLVALKQVPTAAEAVGIGLVAVAVAVRPRSAQMPAQRAATVGPSAQLGASSPNSSQSGK